MRAVLCEAWGGPEGLRLAELPAPEPGPGEVAIAVRAAGINFADILMIAGRYQEKPPLPFVPAWRPPAPSLRSAPASAASRSGRASSRSATSAPLRNA